MSTSIENGFAVPLLPRPSRLRLSTVVYRAAVLVSPLKHLDVAATCRERARPRVPRASVLARPPKHLEVAARRRVRARRIVPRAAVLVRSLKHLEVTALCRARVRRIVPRAAVLARPLQHLEVATLRPSRESSSPTNRSDARETCAKCRKIDESRTTGRMREKSFTSADPSQTRQNSPVHAR